MRGSISPSSLAIGDVGVVRHVARVVLDVEDHAVDLGLVGEGDDVVEQLRRSGRVACHVDGLHRHVREVAQRTQVDVRRDGVRRRPSGHRLCLGRRRRRRWSRRTPGSDIARPLPPATRLPIAQKSEKPRTKHSRPPTTITRPPAGMRCLRRLLEMNEPAMTRSVAEAARTQTVFGSRPRRGLLPCNRHAVRQHHPIPRHRVRGRRHPGTRQRLGTRRRRLDRLRCGDGIQGRAPRRRPPR